MTGPSKQDRQDKPGARAGQPNTAHNPCPALLTNDPSCLETPRIRIRIRTDEKREKRGADSPDAD